MLTLYIQFWYAEDQTGQFNELLPNLKDIGLIGLQLIGQRNSELSTNL